MIHEKFLLLFACPERLINNSNKIAISLMRRTVYGQKNIQKSSFTKIFYQELLETKTFSLHSQVPT